MKKWLIIGLLSTSFLLPKSIDAKSGCCSWHGGVAGCSSSGRQVCNDGTLSPSCTCVVQAVTYTPVPTKALTPKPATPKPTIVNTPKPTNTSTPGATVMSEVLGDSDTPTSAPTNTPTSEPINFSEAKEENITSPTPISKEETTKLGIAIGLVTGTMMLGGGYLGLKWLARVTASRN